MLNDLRVFCLIYIAYFLHLVSTLIYHLKAHSPGVYLDDPPCPYYTGSPHIVISKADQKYKTIRGDRKREREKKVEREGEKDAITEIQARIPLTAFTSRPMHFCNKGKTSK